MNGRSVPPRRESCKHAWVIGVRQVELIALECEFCRAAVVVEVGTTAVGHSFMFGVLRGRDRVSNDDLAALGEWFGREVGDSHAVHIAGPGRHRRRRSPAPAA